MPIPALKRVQETVELQSLSRDGFGSPSAHQVSWIESCSLTLRLFRLASLRRAPQLINTRVAPQIKLFSHEPAEKTNLVLSNIIPFVRPGTYGTGTRGIFQSNTPYSQAKCGALWNQAIQKSVVMALQLHVQSLVTVIVPKSGRISCIRIHCVFFPFESAKLYWYPTPTTLLGTFRLV